MRVIVSWEILGWQTVVSQPCVAYRDPFVLGSCSLKESYSCRLWTAICSGCAEPEYEIIVADPANLLRYRLIRPSQTWHRTNCKNRVTYHKLVVRYISRQLKPFSRSFIIIGSKKTCIDAI